MKVTVAKLVSVILEKLEATGDKPPTEKAMRVYLMRQGYKRTDIDTALEFINTNLTDAPVYSDQMPAMRQLAFYETTKVGREVHHTMARLELLGLLNPMEREMLLERFIHSEGQADMESLDFALAYMVGTTRNAETQQALLSAFEGYGPTVH